MGFGKLKGFADGLKVEGNQEEFPEQLMLLGTEMGKALRETGLG